MNKVKWQELFPHEFLQMQNETPIVYLPMGICEPHGMIAVLGLDLIKAEWLCNETAHRSGGIVAPSVGYQIHESGYHAPWLAEQVGNVNAMMTGMPPLVMLQFFLYQLRAFSNAGFKAAIIITGHAGGNEQDYRLAAKIFMKYASMQVKFFADPELVTGLFNGDHAGQYEISQLLFLKEDAIRNSEETDLALGLGRFALGTDYSAASKEKGQQIMEACLDTLVKEVDALRPLLKEITSQEITYEVVENIWGELYQKKDQWVTTRTNPNQTLAPDNSVWKKYEKVNF